MNWTLGNLIYPESNIARILTGYLSLCWKEPLSVWKPCQCAFLCSFIIFSWFPFPLKIAYIMVSKEKKKINTALKCIKWKKNRLKRIIIENLNRSMKGVLRNAPFMFQRVCTHFSGEKPLLSVWSHVRKRLSGSVVLSLILSFWWWCSRSRVCKWWKNKGIC